jgi:arylsulfatase A-like enzyme
MRDKSAFLAAASERQRETVISDSLHAGPPHSRREFLRSAAATGAVVMGSALFGKTPASSTPEARPNIVFFLGEGARWDESSLAENSLLKTPHIDRIGREGALFRNAFCINSLCLPAPATILSGLYSHTSGAVDNQHSKVPKKFPIVTDLIRNGGYEITFIGKSHVEGALMDRYWDYYFGFRGQADYLNPRRTRSQPFPGQEPHAARRAATPRLARGLAL